MQMQMQQQMQLQGQIQQQALLWCCDHAHPWNANLKKQPRCQSGPALTSWYTEIVSTYIPIGIYVDKVSVFMHTVYKHQFHIDGIDGCHWMSCRLCMLCSSMCSSKFSNLSWSHSTVFSVPRCPQWPSTQNSVDLVKTWCSDLYLPHAASGPARRTCGGNQGDLFHSTRLFTWMLICRMRLSRIQRFSQVNTCFSFCAVFVCCCFFCRCILFSSWHHSFTSWYILTYLDAVHFVAYAPVSVDSLICPDYVQTSSYSMESAGHQCIRRRCDHSGFGLLSKPSGGPDGARGAEGAKTHRYIPNHLNIVY